MPLMHAWLCFLVGGSTGFKAVLQVSSDDGAIPHPHLVLTSETHGLLGCCQTPAGPLHAAAAAACPAAPHHRQQGSQPLPHHLHHHLLLPSLVVLEAAE